MLQKFSTISKVKQDGVDISSVNYAIILDYLFAISERFKHWVSSFKAISNMLLVVENLTTNSDDYHQTGLYKEKSFRSSRVFRQHTSAVS